MSIDTSAVIIVGLPRDDLKDHEKFVDFCDGTLEQISPYYDGYIHAILGVVVQSTDDYSANELVATLADDIEKAKVEFTSRTGRQGKVFLTPYVH